MEKHCDSKKRFGKEDNVTEARNEILEKFIRDSGSKAYEYAHRLSGNREDAKELVQEAFYLLGYSHSHVEYGCSEWHYWVGPRDFGSLRDPPLTPTMPEGTA